MVTPLPSIDSVSMVKLGLSAGGIGRAASMGLGGAALGALLSGKQEAGEETGDYALRLLRNVGIGGLGGAAAPSLLRHAPAAAKAVGRGVGRGAAAVGRGIGALGSGIAARARLMRLLPTSIPSTAGSMLAGGALGAGASVLGGDTENLARDIALGTMAGGVAPTLMRAGNRVGRWSKLHPSVLGGNIGALLGLGGAGAAGVGAAKALNEYGR